MKFFETAEFKRLNKQWRKRLKRSGFKDIERSESQLSSYSYEIFRNYSPFIEDYYAKTLNFLNSYKFECETDRFIWKLYCDGCSYRQISTELERSTTHRPLKHAAIGERIKALESLMLNSTV